MAGEQKIVFVSRGPLVFVAVARTLQSETQVRSTSSLGVFNSQHWEFRSLLAHPQIDLSLSLLSLPPSH